MKNSKLNKIIRAGAAVLMAGTLCGCSVKFGTHKEPKPNAVVAYATKGENTDDLKVTYEEFKKEYQYILVNNDVTDDTDETIAAACKQQRSTIINSLINVKIFTQKAKEMGLSEFSEEEQKEIDEEYDKTVESFIGLFGDRAERELAESQTSGESSEEEDSDTSAPTMTDEEKREAGIKKLDEMLEKCGMDREDMRMWEVNQKIIQKLQDAIYNSVDRAEAEKRLKELQSEGEEYYKSDISKYEQGGYSQIWLPEGSRMIKHVLLAFDSETQTQIRSLRSEEKDDEADKLRKEKAEALKSKQDEVEKKLDEGEKIEELIKQYSADKSGSEAYPDGYTVIPNGTTYMEEFQKAAFVPKKIGERTICVTDYGVHIMVYASDAKVSDEELKKVTDQLYAQLGSDEFDKKYAEWIEEFAFEIDYDALRLDKPEEESSAVFE